jgi:hypothetical protein
MGTRVYPANRSPRSISASRGGSARRALATLPGRVAALPPDSLQVTAAVILEVRGFDGVGHRVDVCALLRA